jgi:hypothetical protein
MVGVKIKKSEKRYLERVKDILRNSNLPTGKVFPLISNLLFIIEKGTPERSQKLSAEKHHGGFIFIIILNSQQGEGLALKQCILPRKKPNAIDTLFTFPQQWHLSF